MLVATFGPSTAWAGRTITFESSHFVLQGHGSIRATDVMDYAAAGTLRWQSEGTRAWVGALAKSERERRETAAVPRPNELDVVRVGRATYIGGNPSCPGWRAGLLWISRDWIGLETSKRRPLECAIPMADVAYVSVESSQTAKSRVGPVLVFGLAGLGAKSSEDHVYFIVTTKAGLLPTYELEFKSAAPVRAGIAPLLSLAGVELR